MSDILTIGGSAIAAYQRALGTVSNNIANLNTEGYSRQDVTLAPSTPENRANIYLGTGVVVNGVKRAYSEFAASSLRSSFSSLNTQDPLVNYSNRIVDVMGSAKSGLTSALDQFFTSAKSVSASPASAEMRGQFLTSADGVAGRLRELSGQLQGVETDTREEINADLEKINTITSQLATVNAQLRQNGSTANQSPVLLDQRDQLLNELAKIAGISVSAATNGEVSVSLGSFSGRSVILSGTDARPLGALFSESSAGKVDILIDPYGKQESVNNLDSGSLAGLISFRQQALEPAQSQLDTLTQVFATEVNNIQTTGIDGRGQVGKPLYTIAPSLQLDSPEAHPDISVSALLIDPAATQYHDIALSYDDVTHVWTATDVVDKKSVKSSANSGELIINGMKVTVSPTPQSAISLKLNAFQRPASTIQIAQTDPMSVAAGALFRVTPAAGNVGATNAAIDFSTDSAFTSEPSAIDRIFKNNANDEASVQVVNSPSSPVKGLATVPAGFGNIALMLNGGPDSSLNLQVLTRDGRQVLGTPLDAQQKESLLTPQNGFIPGASFSADYLNKTGQDAYRHLDLFYGALATPGGNPAFDEANNLVDRRNTAAQLDASVMPVPAGNPSTTYIANGALSLNGISLGALNNPASGSLQARDVAQWINSQVPANSDVVATASTSVRIKPSELLTSTGNTALSINGTAIYGNGTGSFANVAAIESAINAVSNTTGVTAVTQSDGSLVLANVSGQDMIIGTPGHDSSGQPAQYFNALGFDASADTILKGELHLQSASDIRLGIGINGSASDLAKLGFRTGAYINGSSPEDLLVFQTGTGTGRIAASYQSGTIDLVASQRAMPLIVTFTKPDSYTITDSTTGQVLAERIYHSGDDIQYGTLTLHLNTPAQQGDQFSIDGNQDGTGSNENILKMAALDTKAVMPKGQTISEGYNTILTSVGNVSSQAQIAQQALTVVNQQAVQARDQVSGVNLDNEAADLIRFQQAYQAAAKTMQIATQLFDSIIQIR
jgi:flagellar hook-associated protein FlgK